MWERELNHATREEEEKDGRAAVTVEGLSGHIDKKEQGDMGNLIT